MEGMGKYVIVNLICRMDGERGRVYRGKFGKDFVLILYLSIMFYFYYFCGGGLINLKYNHVK